MTTPLGTHDEQGDMKDNYSSDVEVSSINSSVKEWRRYGHDSLRF